MHVEYLELRRDEATAAIEELESKLENMTVLKTDVETRFKEANTDLV